MQQGPDIVLTSYPEAFFNQKGAKMNSWSYGREWQDLHVLKFLTFWKEEGMGDLLILSLYGNHSSAQKITHIKKHYNGRTYNKRKKNYIKYRTRPLEKNTTGFLMF